MPLTIDYKPINLNGQLRAELVAKIGDKVIHRDQVNLGSDSRRKHFIRELCKRTSETTPDALEAELLRIAGELRDEADADGEAGPVHAVLVRSKTLLAETIIHPTGGHLTFFVCDRAMGEVSEQEYVEIDGIRIQPPDEASAILCTPGFGERGGAVLLPTGVEDYGSDADLIRDVQAFIHRYVELPGAYEAVATYYALFTWVYDQFDELPYLRFRNAEFGRGKSRALETVGSICYRPIFAGGGSSAAAMRRIIDQFRGTLVGDEQDAKGDGDLTSTWIKILNQGFQRGRPLIVCDGDPWKPRKFDIFGPKLLATRKRLADDATESRCLTIPIEQRTRDDIPKNLPRRRFDREALALRNKLLLWRFRNWEYAELNESLAIDGVEDRLNQIAVPLLSVIRDEAVRASVVGMLRGLQGDIQVQKSETWAGQIVEYLDARWSADMVDIIVGDVAKHLNERMAQEQGVEVEKLRSPVTPHKAGKIIRDELGLHTHRRGGSCKVQHDAKRLGELRQRYIVGATPVQSPASPDRPSPDPKSCAQQPESNEVANQQDLQNLQQDMPVDLLLDDTDRVATHWSRSIESP